MLTVPAGFPLNRKMRRLAARGKLRIVREDESGGLGAGAPRRQDDRIYDAAVLRMASCFEHLIREKIGDRAVLNYDNINAFRNEFSLPRRIYDAMIEITDERNNIAHQRIEEYPVDFEKFKVIRTRCLHVDRWVREKLKMETGVRNVMVSAPLPYPMGNAGDVIKHGALAELVDWRFSTCQEKPLRYADPFGGRPWSTPGRSRIAERIKEIARQCAIRKAQPDPDSKIYGSAHAVLNVARAVGGESRVQVYASDRDERARSDLQASSDSVRLIDVAFDGRGYDNQDGYSILNPNLVGEFDLILIDPYKDFLRDEFWTEPGKPGKGRFNKMLEVVGKHRDLWLAVFVLNWRRGNSVGEGYDAFYKRKLAGRVLGLRCPKISGSGVKGENQIDETDILLISSQVGDGKADGIRKRLEVFRKSASSALGAEIDFLS